MKLSIMDKTEAKQKLSEKIAQFQRELASGKIQDYAETATRYSYIDQLLTILGWTISDHNEVVPEYRIHKNRKKVDYALKIDGEVRLYIEAKDIRKPLKVENIEQALGYGYSKGGPPFVLLTNFKDIKLFDVTIKPDPRNATKGLKIDLSLDQYLEQFDKLWLLSKGSVNSGELDKLLFEKSKDRKPVDKSLLDNLKTWRQKLAWDIFKNNQYLFHSDDRDRDAAFLREITQEILDRIIFMRSCEDRGLMRESDSLKALFEGRADTVSLGTMVFLKREFQKYNDTFNSDLFKHKDWEDDLKIEFSELKKIVLELYYPYQFDAIPLDILGNIYEQYLAYTIRVTDHQVKYELKPEIGQKGKGAYYTPEYIVDYIAKNTVGKYLDELSSKRIENITILDPACGSGSFLIKAYDTMLNYYLNKKKSQSKKKDKKDKLPMEHKEEVKLTIQEKSNVLQKHIYGVDIDPQAVKVTKLSLMLKMLEREYEMIPGRAILPMLDQNIKHGNSLIENDYFSGNLPMDKEMRQINAFNWDGKDGFPSIMKSGGFDIVIGNPPYGAVLSNEDKKYLFNKYPLIKGQPESYEYFLFRSLLLSSKNGLISFIVPNNFIESDRAEGLRITLLKSGNIKLLSNFRYNVWKENASETLVIIFEKASNKTKTIVVHPKSPIDFSNDVGLRVVNQSEWLKVPGNRFLIRSNYSLITKIEKGRMRLGDICEVSQGIIVYKTRKESSLNPYISNKAHGKEWKKLLDTESTIKRYNLFWGNKYLKYGEWLWCPRDIKYFDNPKILFVRLRNKSLNRKLVGTFDDSKYFNRDNFNNIILKNDNYSLKYVLGLFNSVLLNYWYKAYFDNVNINPTQVRLLPLAPIDFTNSDEKACHVRMAKLADRMLELHKRLSSAKSEGDRAMYQRQINATDTAIDNLVYDLYDISPEEREIIKDSLNEKS